jgi:tRNA(fMet)-specific endonuclease VapC
MQYLLDTNICIYLMRQQPPAVARRFGTLRRGDVGMSVITLAELRYGIEVHQANRKRNEHALSALLTEIPAVPFDAPAAKIYGVIRAAVRDRKRDALDRLIAAHAISAGLTLVTNNVADFDAYPGLRVENWVE